MWAISQKASANHLQLILRSEGNEVDYTKRSDAKLCVEEYMSCTEPVCAVKCDKKAECADGEDEFLKECEQKCIPDVNVKSSREFTLSFESRDVGVCTIKFCTPQFSSNGFSVLFVIIAKNAAPNCVLMPTS